MDTMPQVVTSHYGYSTYHGFDPTEYWLFGISLNFLYDSRDNLVNPYSERYAYANIRINPEFLGSTQNSSIETIQAWRQQVYICRRISDVGYSHSITSGKKSK